MANDNTPKGLVPVRSVNGQPYTGGGNIYSVAAGDGTLLGLGDLVKLAGTGQTINDNAYADVVRAATGDVFVGVVVSVIPVTRDSTVYREASTQRLLEVCDDPNMLFEVQEGGGGTAMAINDLGLNANIVVANANTTTGWSGTLLDNSTPPATTNTFDLKVVGFVNKANNAVGASAKWLVRINRHLYANQVAGT
jgi:hypothetical protein